MHRLKGIAQERQFVDEVIEKSGQNLLECLQCGKCTGSCPISSAQVGGPRQLIARILAGMKDEALQDPTWWYCVSCGTCANRCPVEINMYPVATVLCEMAEAQGVVPSEPDIHRFEALFLDSVRRYGRVQELKTVMQFNLRSFESQVDKMSREQAQQFLVKLYEQMMMRETMYKHFLKHEWGIGPNPQV